MSNEVELHCELTSAPRLSYVGVLTPSTSELPAFGEEAFKEVIKVKWVTRVGPDPIGLGSL